MPLCSDVESVLGLLDQMQTKMKGEASDPRLLSQVNDEINTLLSVLTNPMFQRICKIKDSVNELGDQMIRHPSITTNDFDITPEGTLVVKISPPAERYKAQFDTTLPFDQANAKANAANAAAAAASSSAAGVSRASSGSPSSKYNGETVMPITTPTYEEEFERVLTTQAQGRQVHKITLFKPEGGSLGFSVVGLKSQEKGELGIFVQELQPNGIAARDGRLQEGDQILAIDGQPLDSAITHQQAIGILQQSRGEVEIVIARAPDSAQLSPTGEHPVGQPFTNLVGGVGAAGERPTSASSNTDSKFSEMVLNTEWAQVEVIELINDGTGLGFGIIGGRSTGVVVKTILPGGVADRDGRLQSGDHILQIGDVNLLGMGSEQVAAVLRQCGSCVRLVVARPIEPTSPDALSSHAPIVPTRILGDPEELERHLIQSNGYSNHYGVEGSMSMGSMGSGLSPEQLGDDELSPTGGAQVPAPFDTLPEVEIVDVELHKDSHGLGITIAGYVCEKEELSGIFVKSISEGSAADLSKRIQINDRIVEVDGQSLQGFTNHEAVEVLRKTGSIVMLKLERYHHGSKYDQDNEELAITPGIGEEDEDEAEEDEEEEEEEEDEELIVETTTRNEDMDLEDLELLIDTRYEGEILATVEAAIMAKWSKIMGQDVEVVVSQLSKSKEGGGLGISLEGTVDVEDGREVRPHHYIRSILADGPVGKAGKLLSGDELLEVNGRRLLGLNHVEVVSILKDLPMHVRLVCARRPGQPPPSRPIDTAQDRNAFAARNILGGSLQNLFQGSDRLVKAKSDGSLASTGTTNATDTSLSKLKSRSLEPLTGLAMWSPEPHIIELPKGERGLGFSILDYQDPMNPSETVIVIRSLVPGGVAQQDGRLIPGDRLLAVNESNLENASLDQAVQALKGAPRGIVRIIVAKPLPLPDTTTMSNTTTVSNTTTHSQEVTPPPPLPLSPPPEVELGMTRKSSTASERSVLSKSGASSVKLSPKGDEDRMAAVSNEDSSVSPPPPLPVSELPPPPPPVPPSEPDIIANQNQVPGLIVPVATERLISSASSTYYGRSSNSTTGGVFPGVDDTSLPPHLQNLPPGILPPALERIIKVKKEEEALGINVELVDEGKNGVMVTSIAIGGPFARDGRIHAGDYLVAINNESLRNVTNAQARAILRRAQLFSKDLSVSYIPGADAEVHRQTLAIQLNAAKDHSLSSGLEETNRSVDEESVSTLNKKTEQKRRLIGAPTSEEEEGEQEQVVKAVAAAAAAAGPSVRTPADGQEAPLIDKKFPPSSTPTTITSKSKPAPSTSTSVNQFISPSVTTSIIRAPPPVPFARSTPPVVPAKPSGYLGGSTTETSTVFINTSEIPVPQATQPTVQKRVVTHVTIFPSPPPDLVTQVSRVTTTTTAPTPKPQQPTPTVAAPPPAPPVQQVTSPVTQPLPPPPPPILDQEVSISDEPTLSVSVSASEPFSAAAQAAVASVVKSEANTASLSLQQSSSLEMVNKEPLSSSEKESSHPSTPTPSVTTVKGGANISGGGGGGSSGDESSALLLAKHWGPERLVQVHREVGKSLGISIVGGKVDLYNAGPDSGSAISGIFIKNVLLNSPAGRTGQLKTGDRILSVDDVDLRSASHERAVEVIRAAGNPVRFLVQSLVHWPGLGDEEKQVIQAKLEAASVASKTTSGKSVDEEEEESEHSSEEGDDISDDVKYQGKIRTKAGIEIDRGSAGNIRRSKDYDPLKDTETEDEFGYTLKKIQKRWGDLAKSQAKEGTAAKLVVADLERGSQGLGISLAGHRNRMKMATYVCGINPTGIAHKTKALDLGDEILEVNGLVVHGRCHLNASAIIKSLPHSRIKIIGLRKPAGMEECSVKPIVQFPVSLESEKPEEKYANYRGLRVVNLKKGPMGLGIMIMEGRHAELGQGIFISDIQEGSVAEQAGLFVGDMILAVNGEDMVGADYDHAAHTLKKTEGNVSIVVCNASKGDEPRKMSLSPSTTDLKEGSPSPTLGEPGKIDKPKLPPKPSKIPSPSKLISSMISSRGKTSPTTPVISPISAPISPHPISILPITPTLSTSPIPTGPVPSVVVKPATPSPKLGSAVVHHPPPALPHPPHSPAVPPNKLALNIKPRASSTGSATDEPPSDPATCEIKPGRETTIEINKDKMGLGLSIVGGSDTLLGSIIIHEVYADGAAAKDSRLRPGDQLLSVNNEDFQNISHTKALAALRQTPTKVKMVVYRDEAIVKEDDMYDITDVDLTKKSGKGLGLSIVGRKNGTGVFISDVVPGGIAELHGGLMKGDMIISVNGHDLKSASQEEAAAVLKTVIGPIRMRIARLKAASSRKSAASTPATVPATPTSDTNDVDVELEESVVEEIESYVDVDVVDTSSNSIISIIPPQLTSHVSGNSPLQVQHIILERGPDGLGFSIVGGHGSPHGNLPIYVKTVFEKGAAVGSGLKRGDQILAVNAIPCDGLTHQEAVALLKNVKGSVSLTILS